MGDAPHSEGKARSLLGLTLGLWLGLAGTVTAPSPNPALAAGRDCPEPETWRRDTFDVGFRRERRLAGLDVPLRSSGRVRSDGEAIWWHTEAPIEMVLRIDRGGISRSIEGGAMEPLGGVSSGGGEIAALTTTLLGGQLARAEADFIVERHRDPATGDWQIDLEPRSASLARLVRRIELTGCDRIERALIDQPSGDQDLLVFGDDE